MNETKYTTDMNYRNPVISAGSVFTEAQWVAKGGKAEGLKGHVAAGYITVWEGQSAPEPIITVSPSPLEQETVTVDSAETEVINLEDSAEEESKEEVIDEHEEYLARAKAKPEGVWNFKAEDLEDIPLEQLNIMYKSHADENGINVRAYKDKDALIAKMCSQAAG